MATVSDKLITLQAYSKLPDLGYPLLGSLSRPLRFSHESTVNRGH